ncbi:hypothetical protein [uncultured Proteiniphilum sp.]|uniref:hypothetical protein n=1 Tax=uncultured Proteiniphilum sp. TaxID=497637 RepID=UPI00261DD62F|nr:hypothetical protein [uncultured Proteiniphilum sp.]
MKQKTIFLVALMLQFCLTNLLATPQTAGDPKEKEKIELKEKEKMTYSDTVIEVEAYHDGSIIELFVNNYTGYVTMHIPGSSLYITMEVNESGYATMDISQLPEGGHTLLIRIGSMIFEGEIEL